MDFASQNLTAGQLNAIVKNLGGHDGALKFLRGELTVSRPACAWRKENGVIYLTVTSDGTTGEQWIEELDAGDYAKQLLRSPDFRPTTGVTYNLAILKGEFWSDAERLTKNIRVEGDKRGWKHGPDLNAEVACLICRHFSEKEIEAMGLIWIVTMHEPIKDSGGDPDLLGARRCGDGRRLGADYGRPGDRWDRGDGFAFALSPAGGGQASSF